MPEDMNYLELVKTSIFKLSWVQSTEHSLYGQHNATKTFVCSRETLEPNGCNINKWHRQQKQSELDYSLDQIFYHLSFLKNQNMDTKWYTARSSFYFCFFSVFLTFLVVFFWSFLISCLMILFLCKTTKKLLLIRWKLQQFTSIIPQIQF